MENIGVRFCLNHYPPPTLSNHSNGPECPHFVYVSSAVVTGFGGGGMVASVLKQEVGAPWQPPPPLQAGLQPPQPVSRRQLPSMLSINQALIFLFTHLPSCCGAGDTDRASELSSQPDVLGGGRAAPPNEGILCRMPSARRSAACC